MTPAQWQRVREVYEAVADQASEARAAALAEACVGDPWLRAEVERLLSLQPLADVFLETPALADPVLLAAVTTLDAPLGQRIGPYQIIRELGQGGMSTVCLAARADDQYHALVAVKLVGPGLHSQNIRRRFKQEQQILANLNHPNIARLLDAGVTAEGLSFLVMEYIDGQPLTTYCQQHVLSVEARLKLFLDVCGAVEYAHQQGVIHRDLKPNNILVTADGVVKLLDFGIAKLLKPEADAAALTRSALLPLTPVYASPEQLRAAAITPASDVYSLGVLLYELLTDNLPYQIDSYALHEVSRLVCEIDPERPSRRVAVLARTQARGSHVKSDKLRRRLQGDLDNIVMVALAKAPAQRYATPAALATDLQRHLAGLPVTVRGKHYLYNLQKRARRQPILSALLLVVLLGGLSAFGWWKVTERTRQLAARHARYASAIEQATLAWQTNRLEDCTQSLLACLPALGAADLRGFEWNYLWRASHQAELVLSHSTGVGDAQFACHGQRILTEAPWNSYWLWDAATGKLLDSWRAEYGAVDFPLFEPEKIINTDADGTFWHKNLCTGERTRLFTDRLGPISQSKAFPGQPEITVGHTNGTISLWSPEQPQPFKVLRGAPGSKEHLRLARGGQRMLTLGDNNLIQLWDVNAGRVLATYHEQVGSAMHFSLDGHYFWALADLRRPTVRESATGRTFAVAAEMDHNANGASQLRADVLAVCGHEKLTLFRFPTLKKLFEFNVHSTDFLAPHLSPDESLLAASTSDGRLFVWAFASQRLLTEVRAHNNNIWHFSFSADGRKIITAGDDGQAKVWDIARLQALPKLEGHQDSIVSVAFSPDGRQLASASFDHTVKLWDVQTGKLLRIFTGHTDLALCVVFSPDGSQLAASSNNGQVLLWEVASGRVLRRFSHPQQTHGVAFSPDSQWLATACSDKNVWLWNLWNEQPPRLLSGHQEIVVSVNFSPDGRRLASGSWDKTAKLWDIATGRALRTFTGHSAWVWSAVFSPDGQWLATSGPDRSAKLWNVATGQILRTFTGHRRDIYEVAFTPDGRRLATASEDRTVRIWDTATGQELLTLDDHTDQVWSVAFSPDGNTLASGSWDKTIRLWRAAKPGE